jgi:general secretion pathway protein D
VEDGGIIVLGGLISDELRESKSQVPFLGSIPLIGELFKTRSVDKVKTNLMVFIRPSIIRDGVDAAIETNAKYNYIRQQQLERGKGRVQLMPGERQPTLPSLEQLVSPEYIDPTRTAPTPAPAPPAPMQAPVQTTEPFGETPQPTPPEQDRQP